MKETNFLLPEEEATICLKSRMTVNIRPLTSPGPPLIIILTPKFKKIRITPEKKTNIKLCTLHFVIQDGEN